MDQELVSRIAATAKSDLQLPDEQLPTIERYVKRAISRILVFCGREDFPPPLEDVAAQIVEDMLRADQGGPIGERCGQRHAGRHQHQLPGQGQQSEGNGGFCEEL